MRGIDQLFHRYAFVRRDHATQLVSVVHDPRTKDAKERGIEILGERTVKKIDISIQDGSIREPPGGIKLIAEIDERVAPFSPRNP